MEFHERVHPRLKGYDYGTNGVYFLTICSRDMEQLFCRILARTIDTPFVELTDIWICVDNTIEHLKQKNHAVTIENYVIMPNHVHMLLVVNDMGGGASGKPRPTNAAIPVLVSSLKRYTNKVCAAELWQDGYYDHIIRDENDLLIHWQYIENNPAKWAEDKYYAYS